MFSDAVFLTKKPQLRKPILTEGLPDLCNRILDVAQSLGCEFVTTVGGLRKESVPAEPHVLCAATDKGTLRLAKTFGAEVLRGHIYGAAGLLVALT